MFFSRLLKNNYKSNFINKQVLKRLVFLSFVVSAGLSSTQSFAQYTFGKSISKTQKHSTNKNPNTFKKISAPNLSANDISILFPAPQNFKDLKILIKMKDLKNKKDQKNIWSSSRFDNFIRTSETRSKVGDTNHKINFPSKVRESIDNWYIAGIRIDAGAPGLSEDIINQFGRDPQIRLIVQPITASRSNGSKTIEVHDIAAHLIFSFSTRGPKSAKNCFPIFVPEEDNFRKIIVDIIKLRDSLRKMKVTTTGKPLNVHPGLVGKSAKKFSKALKKFLEKHLSSRRLNSMAVMGLERPEPWVFLAMLNVDVSSLPADSPMLKLLPVSKPDILTLPVPNPVLNGQQFAQMLNFRGDTSKIFPVPANNNKNPITCRNASVNGAPLPVNERMGVSTANIIDNNVSGAGAKAILARIANPEQSHFFNTDCVSCHTETRLSLDMGSKFPNIASSVLPKETWNVRNFGWFPSFFAGTTLPTITNRTAQETAEVLEFINHNLLRK